MWNINEDYYPVTRKSAHQGKKKASFNVRSQQRNGKSELSSLGLRWDFFDSSEPALCHELLISVQSFHIKYICLCVRTRALLAHTHTERERQKSVFRSSCLSKVMMSLSPFSCLNTQIPGAFHCTKKKKTESSHLQEKWKDVALIWKNMSQGTPRKSKVTHQEPLVWQIFNAERYR